MKRCGSLNKYGMRNYWLDRLKKKEQEKTEEQKKKGLFIYPPSLWKLINKKNKGKNQP